MKATELMIGDWVSYCGFYNKVIYLGQKVSMYDGKGTEFTTDPEYIRPIPLTKEILVKSGFVEIELTDSYELNTDYYEIEVWEFSEGLWVVKVQWIEFSMTPECKATVCYVHQLQHLLQLSGIEKELIID